jgi:hypothetical protein
MHSHKVGYSSTGRNDWMEASGKFLEEPIEEHQNGSRIF